MNNQQRKKILVVGGGTAGWMAAHILAKCWSRYALDVELVESPDIKIIGVGEGSTPRIKTFFDFIGVNESEWMPKCNATYKNGISFKGWSSKIGFEEYFHPFWAQTDQFILPTFYQSVDLKRNGYDINAHPDHFFLASYLANQGLAPIANECFPFNVSYGYHFDSTLLGEFLASKATTANIKHIKGTVQSTELTSEGEIKCVTLTDGLQIHADFFVDCSGFASILLQKALCVPFVSFSSNLFNDSAVVMPTEVNEVAKPQTTATALSNGWVWNIPLLNRYGNGYVYSSAYCSADQAEIEFRAHLGVSDSDTSVRHLKMKVGRVAKHWHKNCLAVGLSQGFIEPLEATALNLVQETVHSFVDAFEGGGFTYKFQEKFNNALNHKFERVRDYIVCHFKVNARSDSIYWRDNADNKIISDALANILDAWNRGDDIGVELERFGATAAYQKFSWLCLLAGYGAFNPKQINSPQTRNFNADIQGVREYVRRCGLNFSSHESALKKLMN